MNDKLAFAQQPEECVALVFKDGAFSFEGDVEQSAKIFLTELQSQIDVHYAKLEAVADAARAGYDIGEALVEMCRAFPVHRQRVLAFWVELADKLHALDALDACADADYVQRAIQGAHFKRTATAISYGYSTPNKNVSRETKEGRDGL